MKILIEDWLRGCVHHDGRKGNVYLPIDKVLQIADYIQRTRTSGTDGFLHVPPWERVALTDIVHCKECKYRDPENKQCDCGSLERQGCKFPVSDEYFCSYGERKE